MPGHGGTTGKLTGTSFRRSEVRLWAPRSSRLLPATGVRHKPPAVAVKSRRDSVWVMSQHRHLDAPRVRLFAAIVLVLISIIGSGLLVVADGIGGDVRWAYHSGASAAPLLLVAAAITAVSIAHPPKGRHALMRLVAILAFAAWGTAQLAPDPGVAGALNDVAILLFVLDAGCAVLSDARALRAAHRRRVPATWPAPGPPSSDRPVLLTRESTPAGVANPTCCAACSARCACARTATASGT